MNIVLRFLRQYVLRYWRLYTLGLVALAATNYLTVTVPNLIQLSLDALLSDGNTDQAINHAMWILPVAVGIMVVRTLSRLLFFNPGRAIEFNFKNAIYKHLQSLPQRFYDTHQVGDLISRGTNDVNYVRGLVGFAGLQIFNFMFALPMTLWKMWAMSAKLTLLALGPMLLALVVLWISIRLLASRMRRNLVQLSKLSEHILESYNAIPTIQGWNSQGAFFDSYTINNDKYTRTQIEISAIRSFVIPLVFLLSSGALILVVWYGGKAVIGQELTIGVIAAFASYITYMVGLFFSFGWTLNVLQRGYISLSRIYEILDISAEEEGVLNEPLVKRDEGFTIEVKDLTFAYPNQEGRGHALEGLSFSVKPGETLGVFGPTGSGKTTLVQLLSRIYLPPRDSVFINGADILHTDCADLRDEMMLIPQDPFLFSRSIRDNIAWGSEADDERLMKAIDMACLTEDLKQLSDGLNTVVGSKGITLSGGQRQRTALARAFYRPFSMLFLDDVLSAVDTKTEQKLIGHIYAAAEKQTTILIANRISVLGHADRILVLDEGKMIDLAPHEVLLERCELYKAAWDIQQETGDDSPNDASVTTGGHHG